MSDSIQEKVSYKPLVLVDTENLPRTEWLEWRRKGIGGSDVAAIMGISPFRTARDIYYDKIKVTSLEDDEEEEYDDGWVAKRMGNLLEPLVAEIFQKRTGFEVFKINKMFYHPHHPFMLADIDYFVKLPDGTIAILEIKTTDESKVFEWFKDGEKIVPVYYESQGRHYMAVTNIDRVFYCCILYGRSENSVVIREIKRDYEYEDEMIFLEQEFWQENVKKKVPPPYTECGKLVLESAINHAGPGDKTVSEISFNAEMTSTVARYIRLQEEKKNSEIHSKQIEDEMLKLKGILIAEMNNNCKAVCEHDGQKFTVTHNPVRKPKIDKDGLLQLEILYPEIYKKFVKFTEYRTFNVRVSKADAA